MTSQLAVVLNYHLVTCIWLLPNNYHWIINNRVVLTVDFCITNYPGTTTAKIEFSYVMQKGTYQSYLSHIMRKPVYAICEQQRRSSSVQSDQRLCCSLPRWTASSEFGTCRLCEQRRFRRACASAQSRQNLRCSLIEAVNQEEPSDRKPDPWPLWMAGHAQLKCVMTECSKTQIR